MNTLLQTNKLVNKATTTAGGFFMDLTLRPSVLKQQFNLPFEFDLDRLLQNSINYKNNSLRLF